MRAKKIKIDNENYYLLLILIAVLAYCPLTLHVFSLKNDALTYFLPYRYHVSEAIQNGSFPFWSPYLYTGLPLHADIQSGAWNPVVLAISVFKRYDMRVLQWETLLYIIIAGIGFFKLGRFFSFTKISCLLLSSAYMCSGFIIDSGSFIPWINSAAYLPFVFLYFLRMHKGPRLEDSLKFGIFYALLFLAGYSSFFIITSYILLFSALVQFIQLWRRNEKLKIKELFKWLSLSVLLTLIIISPALISYIEFFRYYERGSGTTLSEAQLNPFVIENSLSYLFPPASYRTFTQNDISSRNAYFGIIPLLFFFYSLKYDFTRYQNIISGITILFFILSLGDATPVRALFYYALPGMDSFRHPATFRLFTTIGFLLLSGFGLHHFFINRQERVLNRIIYVFVLVISLFMFYHLFFYNAAKEIGTILQHFTPSSTSVKIILDSATASFWLVIAALFQIGFLVVILITKKRPVLITAGILNLVLMTFMCMPFTMLSKHRTKEVTGFIHSFPSGYPNQIAFENVEDRINDIETLTPFGYRNFYTKTVSIQDHIISPTVNDSYGTFLRDTVARHTVSRYPFVFTDYGDSIRLVRFNPNSFSFHVVNQKASKLYLIQQYHHRWKAFVNGQEKEIRKAFHAFMEINIPAGSNSVEFSYKGTSIKIFALISLLILLGCISLLVYFRWFKP